MVDIQGAEGRDGALQCLSAILFREFVDVAKLLELALLQRTNAGPRVFDAGGLHLRSCRPGAHLNRISLLGLASIPLLLDGLAQMAHVGRTGNLAGWAIRKVSGNAGTSYLLSCILTSI